jgi:DNA modification methylase
VIAAGLQSLAHPVAELHLLAGNPRRGDVDAVARSLERFGQRKPIVARRDGTVVAGNHTLQAVQRLGWPEIAVVWVDDDDATAKAFALADNRTAELGSYDDEALAAMVAEVGAVDMELVGAAGYSDADLAALLGKVNPVAGIDAPAALTEPDAVPELPTDAQSKLGDLWLLGPHRVMCGDTTDPIAVRRLIGADVASLIHADPPYGMGKEADGVLNDNLYGSKLDQFQMRWWNAWLPFLTDNGSAYIWGNAPDLWRLWWVGGLSNDADLLVRNEIVWDKGNGIGMRSAGEHSYPTATERALFVMRGQQFLDSGSVEDYWDGHEPFRVWLVAERDKMGWTTGDVNRITGTNGMAGHWFGKSQFFIITRKHYDTLRDAAAGKAFRPTFDQVFRELFPTLQAEAKAHRQRRQADMEAVRSYFDNTHDAMTDVWQFPRVSGEERYGHATPKPVAMVERAMLTSTRGGDVVTVPFGGTGPELIAAHRIGRRCLVMELEPVYVDVICRRYQEHTGTKPERVLEDGTTEPHDFTGS